MIFGKKDNLRVETVLNDGVEIDGDIRVREGIYINTRVKGNITSMPNMEVMAVVSINASITGNVHIPKIYVHGTIKGDVHASNYIEAVVQFLRARRHLLPARSRSAMGRPSMANSTTSRRKNAAFLSIWSSLPRAVSG